MPPKKKSAVSNANSLAGEFKPGMGSPDSPSNPKKKRRTSSTPASNQGPPSTPPNNDLIPPPLSGYGDTIVASNPFDDMPAAPPTSLNHNHSPMSHGPMGPMTMPYMNNMGNMNMKSMGMGGPIGGPMGGPLNGPMGGHMGPNGPMVPGGPMGPGGPMNGSMNGPMPGPMNGPPMPGSVTCSMSMGNVNNMNNMSCSMSMSNSMPGAVGPMTSMSPVSNMGMNGPMPPMTCGMPGPGMNTGSNMGPKPMPVNSGKVYPPDQPMVFNPQNPNAPPIYPCGICHKEVHDNDQAILCESGCNFWFHRVCTGLAESAFHHLTGEVYAEWVCDKCLNSKNIPLVKFKP